MKKAILFLLLTLPLFSYGQEHHLGIRIGEPLSITYKTFLNERFSVEGLIGSAGSNSGAYYRRSFENNKPFPAALYTSHSSTNGFSISARGAYNEDISAEFDIVQGELYAYAGAGIQLRSVRLDYVFQNGAVSSRDLLYETRTNIDFGPEAFVGSEYYFDDLPISVFAEIGLFLEILDRPGHFRLQGGLGARYLF